MKNKLIGIFVMTLLISTAFQVIGTTEENENKSVKTLTNEDLSISSNAINDFELDSIFKSNNVFNSMSLCNYENGDTLDQQQTSSCGRG